jgi:flavin reductase (DIM6/NTAB) family NADH-FMN oxidoreductase RutF
VTKCSEFAVADLSEAERVKLFYGLVIPRPIAVVSSMSSDGFTNIAPFSFFNLIGEDPAALSFSITAQKANGADKDTLRNVRPPAEGGIGEFVVNVATANYVAQIAKCGTSLDFGDSEFEFAGLTPTPSITVKPPRIAEARACFECRTMQIIKVGRSRLVIGEILHVAVQTGLLDGHLRIDAAGLEPVGRLAGRGYCRLGKRFEL